MATLSAQDVERIALLCRLSLTADERERFREQLLRILTYVEKLNEVATDAVEPTNKVTEKVKGGRPDDKQPASIEVMERIRNLAPDREENGIRVPQVFGGE